MKRDVAGDSSLGSDIIYGTPRCQGLKANDPDPTRGSSILGD